MDDTVRIYGITYPCGNYHLLGYTKFLAQGKSVSKGFGDYRYGGIMGFVVSQSLTAISLQYTSPVYFSLIVALSPLVVMLLAAVFLKEPITGKKMEGVVLPGHC